MKRENQLVSGGGVLFLLGVLAFVPPLLDREMLILAWLGSMSQPIGLSAVIVGGVLWSLGRLQQFRDAPPPGIDAAADPEPAPDVAEPQ
ncbi:MAG TPA: hypothetical protein VFJ71_02755 [Candidatus Limnocylindrales bacterium]|nr:hypothetical protein [Candidatus Limnocylindrales bacterium]